MAFKFPEQYRSKTTTPWNTLDDERKNKGGTFLIPGSLAMKTPALYIIASTGFDYEHVSVSTGIRCPTWEEMCRVKDLF